MKAIKKSTLFELAKTVREYERTGDADMFDARVEVAKELSRQAYGDGNAWIAFETFASATVGMNALYPECTNEELCGLFRAMGFEVIDE